MNISPVGQSYSRNITRHQLKSSTVPERERTVLSLSLRLNISQEMSQVYCYSQIHLPPKLVKHMEAALGCADFHTPQHTSSLEWAYLGCCPSQQD